jgi:hypothetical protein
MEHAVAATAGTVAITVGPMDGMLRSGKDRVAPRVRMWPWFGSDRSTPPPTRSALMTSEETKR